MPDFKKYISTLICSVILLLSLTTNWYRELSVSLFLFLVMVVMQKLGRGLVLRELIALYTVFMCLLMPVLGYAIYNPNNYLAKIFVKYMQVPEDVYFGFSLPAMSLFTIAICWPIIYKGKAVDGGGYLLQQVARIRVILKQNMKPGFYLVGIGITFSFISGSLPGAVNFIGILFYFASFAGILYLYFAPNFPFKRILLWLFALFVIIGAIKTGMFTVVAYMGITIFSFFFLGNKISFFRKVLIFLSIMVFVIVLQNVKGTFRKVTWGADYSGNKASLFANLFIENLQKGDALLEKNAFFPLYIRSNQGYNVSLVMRRIPLRQPIDGGTRLAKVFASAFVPRFLWPDKPEAGGKESMKYFTGLTIRGWSTNIGPLGEAYGSFGPFFGILYMGLLGLFVRFAYQQLFVQARKIPMLILWIPFLFYQITYSGETDSLQIFNSLVKSAFFLWLFYKTKPDWFGRKPSEVTHNKSGVIMKTA